LGSAQRTVVNIALEQSSHFENIAAAPLEGDPGSSLPTYFRMELILYSKYVHQWTNTEFNKFLLFSYTGFILFSAS